MKKSKGHNRSIVIMTILFLTALILSFFAFFIGYIEPSLKNAKTPVSPTVIPPIKDIPQIEIEVEEAPAEITSETLHQEKREPEPSPALEPEPSKPLPLGKLIIVIDDAGNNLIDIEAFLRFPGDLTISVLPGLPHSKEVAKRIREAGKTVFLHQPMEAIGGQNPGPKALYTGMTSTQVRQILEQNLSELWPVSGMNNHEGSKATQDETIMETVLDVCREWGIVFLDSRTIATSAAPSVARRLGMNIAERDIFLDNSSDREYIIGQLEQGILKARRTGGAIMIGHTRTQALAAILNEYYFDLVEDGYEFSTINRNR